MANETITKGEGVPVIGTKMDGSDEADMDRMVQQASVPNLASLFKKGKAAGLIKPTTGYGEGT